MSKPKAIRALVRLPEFERDLKRLLKRFRSLESDLETLADYQLELYHGQDLQVGGIERMRGLGFEHPPVYIAKKVACQALKGTGAKSGLRVVYAWFAAQGRVEFVEIYFKGDKSIEDKERLKLIFRDRWRDG